MNARFSGLELGARIGGLRDANSVDRFVAELGITDKVLERFVAGGVPDPNTLARIAKVGGVSVDWLLYGGLSGGPVARRPVDAPDKHDSKNLHVRPVPPPINAVINHALLAEQRETVGHAILAELTRDCVRQWRVSNRSDLCEPTEDVAHMVAERARALRLEPRNIVNATGIIIHTGWGNAPLSVPAANRLVEAAGASATGASDAPRRTEVVGRLLCAVTGAEAATCTTLNAASVAIVASSLASGREIIVAARDLVEISEGARISELMESVGARVIAVGSANCVRIEDYRRAIKQETAVLMRIHASNVAVSGYTEHVNNGELATLAHEHNAIFVENLGGGSFVDLAEKGLPYCPTVRGALGNGADLVLASADKIIGGPQAGIVVGRKAVVSCISSHPMARTGRPGKLTLAALEATLASYVAGRPWAEIPTLRMLAASNDSLKRRAEDLAAELRARGFCVAVKDDSTECGGAVLPGVSLTTWTVRLRHTALNEGQLYTILRGRGLVGRRGLGDVILDLRSLLPEQDRTVVNLVTLPVL